MNQASHNAWRFSGTSNAPLYVETVGNGQQAGDRYSYTTKQENAKLLTEKQCRDFCAYMKQCASVGYWS